MKTLETERLILRPFTDDDIAIQDVVYSDPRSVPVLLYEYPHG